MEGDADLLPPLVVGGGGGDWDMPAAFLSESYNNDMTLHLSSKMVLISEILSILSASCDSRRKTLVLYSASATGQYDCQHPSLIHCSATATDRIFLNAEVPYLTAKHNVPTSNEHPYSTVYASPGCKKCPDLSGKNGGES